MSLRNDLETLDIKYWKNDLVNIKPMETVEELIYASYECKLTEEQKEMVSPVWFSVGRAYLFKDNNYPCIIYNNNNKPIGFINFFTWMDGSAYSWSYFIDLEYQGKGYGKASAKLAVDILTKSNPNKNIKLATEQNNTKAHKLYESIGFKKTSELDGDDIVFVYKNN